MGPLLLTGDAVRCSSPQLPRPRVPVASGGPDPAPTDISVPQTLPSPQASWSPSHLLPPSRSASACVPRKAGSRAQPPCRQPHRPPQPKAPKEIPAEAVREYVDIMEGLLGPACSAPGALAGEWGQDGEEPRQDEDAIYLDPGLLSYIDKLCSQEDFITKVGWPTAWRLEDSRHCHSDTRSGAVPRPLGSISVPRS